MNKEELRACWERYCEGQGFKLNPDEKHVGMILDGVLANEKKSGLKLCPCRISDGTREKDLELLCPCNFETHGTWASQGRCWCGLFVKR